MVKVSQAKVSGAFRDLEKDVYELRDTVQNAILTISCIDGFAQKWLLPRLEDFRRLNPRSEIDLQLT